VNRVVVTEPIHPCGIELLRSEADVVYLPEIPEGKLEDYIGGAEGLAVRVARIGRELIEGAPKLRVIAKHGVGYDNIDVAAATARRVAVVYTPNANITSVAEHILSLMLSLANKVCRADRELRHGTFRTREEYVGVELQGKKLSLIGAGRTGTGAAQRCRAAFGMEVTAYDPYAGWSGIEGQADWTSFSRRRTGWWCVSP
jgi:D-3-phosphoglycerate dehydrogenase